ncbi:hypothetical protein KGF54_000609 [Candida jiufengensis]|uniref:uncharacterized protein n=1 Tax=Candida jiufengensis TaxID=497108 RepID=UPI0022252E96|nr:uncharacterized protein KGF54_000609 [Candida jiufengensis]KAI5956990.1 hypothetical protein KGF54_000609 [Candida jiufengensis]
MTQDTPEHNNLGLKSYNDSKKEPNSITSYFGKLKNTFFNRNRPQSSSNIENEIKSHQQEQSFNPDTENQNLFDPLSNQFTKSEKRKRLSIVGHITDEAIPRSLSTAFSNTSSRNKSYSSAFSNSIKLEEELNNDLERRKSIKDGYLSRISDMELSNRDESPSLIIPLNSKESQLSFENDTYVEKSDYFQLNPQERNKLVQLKLLSQQSSEPRRKKMKYSKSPNESMSEILGNSSMVNTSTQTHNLDYLDKKLNFRKRVASSQLTNQIKRQKKKGFQLKEFFYDTKEFENDSLSGSLKNYANKVGKPKFNLKNDIKNTESDTEKGFGPTPKRNHIALNEKLSLSLDPDYLNKTKSIADIIKVKEDIIVKENKKPAIPSSGFKFDINPEKINKIINSQSVESEGNGTLDKVSNKRKHQTEMDDESTKSDNGTEQFAFFGQATSEPPKAISNNSNPATDDKVTNAPKFKFGLKPNKESETTNATFNFGKKPEVAKTLSNDKSLFGETTPKFQFGKEGTKAEKEDKNEESGKEQPFNSGGLFGADNLDRKTKSSSPIASNAQNESKTSLFDFKSNTQQPTTFTYYNKFTFPTSNKENTQNDSRTDNESNTANVDKNTFSFTPNASNATKSNSLFSFDKPIESATQSTTSSSNLFSFTKDKRKSNTPPSSFNFNIGKTDEISTNNNEANKPPLFDFGKKSDETQPKVVELENKQDEKEKTPQTDDSTSNTNKPAFSFSINAPKAQSADPISKNNIESSDTENETKKPKFSFNIPKSNDENNKSKTPTFNFGTNMSSKETSSNGPEPSTIFGSTKADNSAQTSIEKVDSGDNTNSTFQFGAPKSSTTQSNGFKFATGVTPPPTKNTLFGNPSTTSSTKPFSFQTQPSTSTSNTASSFTFGQQQQPPPQQQQQQSPFGNAFPNNVTNNNNTNSNSSSVENAFGSRPTTPAGFNFGNSNPTTSIKNPSIPQFNFTGSKEPTPDPASIFGYHAQQVSREATPFGGSSNTNGGNTNVFGSINSINFGGGANNNTFGVNTSTFGQQSQQPQSITTPTGFGMGSTPPAFSFGNNNNINSPNPVTNTSMNNISGGLIPTPPQPNPRRMAQPRSRRR